LESILVGTKAGLFLALRESWEDGKPFDGGLLNGSGYTEGTKSEDEGGKVHSPANWSGREDVAECGVSDHEELDVDFDEEDNSEPPVAMESFEHVEFSFFLAFQLSAVPHVEQVHHHEGLEEEGVVHESVGGGLVLIGVVVWRGDKVVSNSEHGGSSEEEDEHDNSLVEELGRDGSPHVWGEDLIVLLDTLGSQLCFVWCFGAKGNGSHHVHDDVDPKELDD